MKELLSNNENIALLINVDNFTEKLKSKITVPTHWVGLQAIKDDIRNNNYCIYLVEKRCTMDSFV